MVDMQTFNRVAVFAGSEKTGNMFVLVVNLQVC